MISVIPRMSSQFRQERARRKCRRSCSLSTDMESKWPIVPGDKAFIGRVGETDFKFLPKLGEVLFAGVIMHVKDSFLPVIVGQIREQETGRQWLSVCACYGL